MAASSPGQPIGSRLSHRVAVVSKSVRVSGRKGIFHLEGGFRLIRGWSLIKGSILTLGCGLILSGASCKPASEELPTTPEPHSGPHVLLLSIDTLRADHLGSYGYPLPTSPHLDAFAGQSRRYTEAFAPSPWTLPSHAALLTGAHPFDLGLRHKDSMIPQKAPSLAGELARAGYQTAAFVDSGTRGYVGAERGFARGFHEFHHAPHRVAQHASRQNPNPAQALFRYDMRATVDAASQWLHSRETHRPFFLFLHTKSVHAFPTGAECADPRCPPYDQPVPHRLRFADPEQAALSWNDPSLGKGQEYLWSINRSVLDPTVPAKDLSSQRLAALIAQYDSGIRFVDEEFGRLLRILEDLNLAENTLVIVTSDHGEAFFEHGLLMHQEVYRQTLRIPMLIRPVGAAAPVEIPQPVALGDLAPTVLAEVGLGVPDAMTGRVLPKAAQGEPLRRPLFAYYLFPPIFDYRAFSLLDGSRRLVYDNFDQRAVPEPRLYDSHQDPAETHPLAGQNLELLGRLAELRERLQKSPSFEAEYLPGREIDEDHLKSLGYID